MKYLFEQGFDNTFLLDFSKNAITQFRLLCPEFPEEKIVCEDFFVHNEQYDLILEQTFFSSLMPNKRMEYVVKMHQLLKPEGKLCGLFFLTTTLKTHHHLLEATLPFMNSFLRDIFNLNTSKQLTIQSNQGQEENFFYC